MWLKISWSQQDTCKYGLSSNPGILEYQDFIFVCDYQLRNFSIWKRRDLFSKTVKRQKRNDGINPERLHIEAKRTKLARNSEIIEAKRCKYRTKKLYNIEEKGID